MPVPSLHCLSLDWDNHAHEADTKKREKGRVPAMSAGLAGTTWWASGTMCAPPLKGARRSKANRPPWVACHLLGDQGFGGLWPAPRSHSGEPAHPGERASRRQAGKQGLVTSPDRGCSWPPASDEKEEA